MLTLLADEVPELNSQQSPRPLSVPFIVKMGRWNDQRASQEAPSLTEVMGPFFVNS